MPCIIKQSINNNFARKEFQHLKLKKGKDEFNIASL